MEKCNNGWCMIDEGYGIYDIYNDFVKRKIDFK
jgi:hypothetical protein